MEVLKLVPQIFFDLIARVAPGLLALFVLDCDGTVSWSGLLTTVSGGRIEPSNAFAYSAFTAVVGAYLIGHLLSLVSKGLETVADHCAYTWSAIDSVLHPRKAEDEGTAPLIPLPHYSYPILLKMLWKKREEI